MLVIDLSRVIALTSSQRLLLLERIRLHVSYLGTIRLSLLARMLLLFLHTELLLMLFEELGWLRWMLACDIVECGGGDVVSLSFSDKRIVLKEILELGWVKVGL